MTKRIETVKTEIWKQATAWLKQLVSFPNKNMKTQTDAGNELKADDNLGALGA